MIEGLWVATIEAGGGTSNGVVVFTNGKLLGGDEGFFWLGTYSVTDVFVKARFAVKKFDPSVRSVFALEDGYEMHFSGQFEGDSLTGTAVVQNQPQHHLALRLLKKASL